MASGTDNSIEELDLKSEEKLKMLECPFNWEMDDIDMSVTSDYKPHDEEEFIPLLKLIRIVMTIFVQTKENDEPQNIRLSLNKCDEAMATFKTQRDPQISIEVVEHLVYATKCNALTKLNLNLEAGKILKSIKEVNTADKMERSTLNACRSMCWSKYHKLGSDDAVEFIRKALIDNPECDLYHFILGKNLRRIRRDSSVGALPTHEESTAFLKAYEKNKNVVYGIFVAQMLREERNQSLALKMYEEIYRSKPKSHTIYLRLALGFIQLYKLPLAKQCLDQVAAKCPDDCMYLHYRGQYLMKIKSFKEAAHYLKRAADKDNFFAARQYLRCMLKMNYNYDATPYLLELIQKYKTLPEKQIQNLLLDCAVSYLKKNNLKEALKYFLHCIEIDPKSQTLLEYYSLFQPGVSQDVYKMLVIEVFPIVRQKLATLDENTVEIYEELVNYQEEHLQDRIKRIL